jgi:hypothetical protein
MRDSRTAISQNGTVQRLTYLTIGYLPIALMAVSLTASRDQEEIFTYTIAGNIRYPKRAERALLA